MNSNLKPSEKVESPFMCFCQKVIPLAFDESMSYYEQLCNLMYYFKNTVIPALNNNAEALEEVQQAFIQLENYVNTYFDNLDIQEEVNNKLDEMAESGELSEIIALYIQSSAVLGYQTVADMKLAENLVEGSICKTISNSEIGDDGGRYYFVRTVTTGDVIDEVNIISLSASNTLVAQLINDDRFTNLQTNITNVDNKIGTLSNLETTSKTNVVSAINEVVGDIEDINENLGKSNKIPMIFDGDLCGDVDDFIALRLMNWGSKHSNINPIGINISVYNDNIAPAVDALMRFDDVPLVPIGYDSDKTKSGSSTYLTYMTNYPHGITKTDNCEDAVKLYRKLLVESESKVRIVCTGYLLNISNLLKSQADDISSKTGIQLVSEKVDAIFIMGGKYPSSSGTAEYNFANDPLSAKYVCENSPVRLVFSGYENGYNMYVGLPLLADDSSRKDILTQAIYNHQYSGASGSKCWDALLMLYALYDSTEDIHFNLIQGTNTVSNDGNNTFTTSSSGLHYYLQMNEEASYYINLINNRMWSKKYTNINSSYVNNPTVIGMDGNGKPIYRRFFQFTIGDRDQDNYINFVSFDRIFNYTCGFLNSDGSCWTIPNVFTQSTTVNYIGIWFDAVNSRIVEKHNYAYPSGKTGYIIVDYTLA